MQEGSKVYGVGGWANRSGGILLAGLFWGQIGRIPGISEANM